MWTNFWIATAFCQKRVKIANFGEFCILMAFPQMAVERVFFARKSTICRFWRVEFLWLPKREPLFNNRKSVAISSLRAILRQLLHTVSHKIFRVWKSCGENEKFSTNSQIIHDLATRNRRGNEKGQFFPDTFLSLGFLWCFRVLISKKRKKGQEKSRPLVY